MCETELECWQARASPLADFQERHFVRRDRVLAAVRRTDESQFLHQLQQSRQSQIPESLAPGTAGTPGLQF